MAAGPFPAGGVAPSQEPPVATAVAAQPETPTGSGLATFVIPDWAGGALSTLDHGHLATAWAFLTPPLKEEAAFQVFSYLSIEDGQAPCLTSPRSGAFAGLSASYRRLQAGGNVGRVQPAFKESHTEQQTPSPPNFLLPLLGGLAFALFNRAQGVVAEVEVRKSVMSRIVGSHRSEARRLTAYRLYQDVRRALATGTDEDTLGLATALTLFALDTAAEVGRIKISATPSDDSAAWLGAVLPHLESHRPAFRGVITALVAAERAAVSPGQPAAATAPGAAPPLDTRVDPLARLANMNRSPAYDPAGLGWNHPSSRTTNNWTGVGLEPCPVSPFAHQLPLPDAGGKESAKRSCPGKEPRHPRILGNQCPSCASKKTPGGCVARYSLAESGPASQQCQLSLLETPSLALLWNLSGLPKQDGDEDDRGLPSYLEGADPPGWPLPEEYGRSCRPCGVPLRNRDDARYIVPQVRRRPPLCGKARP